MWSSSDPRVISQPNPWLPNPAERNPTNMIEHHRTWWATAQAQMSFIYIYYTYTYIYIWVEYQPLSIKNNKEMKATRLSYTDTTFLDNWNLFFSSKQSTGPHPMGRMTHQIQVATLLRSEYPELLRSGWAREPQHPDVGMVFTTSLTHKKWWFGGGLSLGLPYEFPAKNIFWLVVWNIFYFSIY